jgi:septal ring factor EnvC (AmiA/AmiB activator)
MSLSTGTEGGLSATSAGKQPASENSWIPWAIGSLAVLALGLFFVSSSSKAKNTVDKSKLEQTQRELDELRNLSNKQNIQFHEAQQQTQQILESQQRQLAETNQAILSSSTGVSQLKETLSQLQTVAANQDTLDFEEDDLPIKSWIESS